VEYLAIKVGALSRVYALTDLTVNASLGGEADARLYVAMGDVVNWEFHRDSRWEMATT
jgi:hypothetical protein